MVVQSIEIAHVSAQMRTEHATSSKGDTGYQGHQEAENHRPHPTRFRRGQSTNREVGKKDWETDPLPHPSVQRLLEGSAFSTASALKALEMALESVRLLRV